MYLNATTTPIEPWKGWADTHYDYSRIDLLPAILWRSSSHSKLVAIELSRWANPICALIFFAFFGFAEEAKRNYRVAFWRILRPFGVRPQASGPIEKSASSK
ncbi:hypothetical protein C0991_000689 [Blastosporella zonata]|nr:hypothetical protein C0991_000689 [Blastosporella zonata]